MLSYQFSGEFINTVYIVIYIVLYLYTSIYTIRISESRRLAIRECETHNYIHSHTYIRHTYIGIKKQKKNLQTYKYT